VIEESAPMTDTSGSQLIDRVKAGDAAGVTAALDAGASHTARDADGWNALDWAAGRGEPEIVALLLDRGADPLATGTDHRTAYQIALSAGHLDAARLLRAAEEAADPASAERHVWQPYAKAYLLGALRAFPGWTEQSAGSQPRADDLVVFLHHDLTVTESIWPGEDVVFHPADAAVTARWKEFCRDTLAFRVPDDFDLVPRRSA
jgi:ankyrin repeat protein